MSEDIEPIPAEDINLSTLPASPENFYSFEYHWNALNIEQKKSVDNGTIAGLPGTDYSFIKRMKWSPEGSFLLASIESLKNMQESYCMALISTGNIFGEDKLETESLPAISKPMTQNIYDICWYPNVSISDGKLFFAVSSRDHPVQFYDAAEPDRSVNVFSPWNENNDKMMSIVSLLFSSNGSTLYGGSENSVFIWDVHTPGAPRRILPTSPSRRSEVGIKGIVSSMDVDEQSGLVALGTFQGQIGFLDERQFNMTTTKISCSSLVCDGGPAISQVSFASGGYCLFSSHRQANNILCFDMRFLKGDHPEPIFKIHRNSLTSQRLYFDLYRHPITHANTILSGDMLGNISIYTIPDHVTEDPSIPSLNPIYEFMAHPNSPISNVSLHPYYPLLASSSGERRFLVEDNDQNNPFVSKSNLSFWKLDGHWKSYSYSNHNSASC